MILSPSHLRGFFPNIYNEDWFFFQSNPSPKRGGSLKVSQFAYSPFRQIQRAISEEFGDLLAEGLASLLKHGLQPEEATTSDWTQLIEDRSRLITDVTQAVASSNCQRRDILTALEASRWRLTSISAQSCVHYVSNWITDHDLWSQYLDHLPKLDDIELALEFLGFTQPEPTIFEPQVEFIPVELPG